MQSLLTWRNAISTTAPHTRPRALSHHEWPPDYDAVYRWRAKTLAKLRADPKALASARRYYSIRPGEFIMDWMDTYDPRVEGRKWMPFIFFQRQMDVVEFIEACDRDQEGGLVEKCRDAGLTWICVAWTVHAWLFRDDYAIGWGSRKEALVDKLGDSDSIFEKLRLVIKRLPSIWHPPDFRWSRHSSYMKLINPANGSYIGGEAGDNIGRGGRKSIFFVDEAAHIDRAEKVDAALGDNTNVRIDISSVNGLGNVFHRRREAGEVWTGADGDYTKGYTRVFIMDWRDHPNKTQEWYDTRRARHEREGLLHIFAQEVDRNYAAAVSNVVIPYEWVTSAVDAHIHIPYFAEAYAERTGQWCAGLDVADDGEDRNSLALREWVILRHVEEWGERDPGVTARRAIVTCRPHRGRIRLMYDSIGIGASVKSEYNRLVEDEGIIDPREIPFIPWNAGAAVLRPYDRIISDDDESLTNKEFFGNLKAQGWWSLRTRFYKTHKALTEGTVYDPDELISIDSNIPLLEQVKKELGQPTYGQGAQLKMIIEKKPSGTKSPNNADAIMMNYFPLSDNDSATLVGNYGY